MKTRIERMKLADLKLLDINARYMRHETFQRLVENIRRDGKMTSVPFACLDTDGRYLVLSGNHRVKAAISAGILEGDVMITDDPLTEQERLALQLSHNAIAGEDDPAILKQLYDRLSDVDLRSYSGLDDKTLKLLDEVKIEPMSEAALTYTSINLTFLPEEVQRAEECLKEAKESPIKTDATWLARWAQYDSFMDALAQASAAHNVKNTATALMVLLDIFDHHKTDLQEGYLGPEGEPKHKGWVPLCSILGTDQVPAPAAAIVKRAVDRMVGKGDVTNKNLWQVLEYLAAEYLGGGND